ncbi:hypothetical protein DL96DRAFT_1714168 [Flagelloscypha sp. PMI_526]|nr:hypothetical protein DL96DRAFT_1714168 [Flagelloscypha sp. PMI_526]
MDLTLGALVVSSWFSFLAMGMVCVLAWQYFSHFGKDLWVLQVTVGATTIMSIITTVVEGVWVYEWGVTFYGNPAIMAVLPISLIIEIFFVGFCSLTVQHFYAWRVWILSGRKNLWLPGIISLLSVTQMISLIYIVNFWTTHRLLADVASVVNVGLMSGFGGSIGADVGITGGMLFYLRSQSKASRFKDTRRIVTRILSRTVQANILSLIFQVATFILYKANLGLYFVFSDFMLVKVYTFSLIVSLLIRRGREAGQNSGVSMSATATAMQTNIHRATEDHHLVNFSKPLEIEISQSKVLHSH